MLALEHRQDLAPLFGAVPHDAWTVTALRPPLSHRDGVSWPTEDDPDAKIKAVFSWCRNVTEVLHGLSDPSVAVDFLSSYLARTARGAPFVLDWNAGDMGVMVQQHQDTNPNAGDGHSSNSKAAEYLEIEPASTTTLADQLRAFAK